MFRSIQLKNFKAYRDSGEIPLAPLTVILGLNNTGKSAILQAILALKQTAQDPRSVFVSQGNFCDLNGFNDILHRPHDNGDRSFAISLALTSAATTAPRIPGIPGPSPSPIADKLNLYFCLGEKSSDIELESAEFLRDGRTFLKRDRNRTHLESELIELPPETPLLTVGPGFAPAFQLASNVNQLTPVMINALQATGINAYVWSQLLGNGVNRVGPIRNRVPWSVGVGVRTPPELSLGGPNLLAALASEEVKPNKKRLLDEVNEWVSRLKLLQRLHPETDQGKSIRMLLADEINGIKDINVAGMGEGISQVLPIIAQCLSMTQNQCLLIEQPEIHLHPALQADLADLFIRMTEQGKDQVIVETHSEHIVLRIRRRIAEGKLSPDQVKILFVEKKGTDSTVRPIDLTKKGSVHGWPDGFFDEAYLEAMAMAEAAAAQRN